MQLLHGIATSLLYGLAVLGDGVQMALHHALHKHTLSV